MFGGTIRSNCWHARLDLVGAFTAVVVRKGRRRARLFCRSTSQLKSAALVSRVKTAGINVAIVVISRTMQQST